jgi:integrase/recombinase XerD
VTGFLVLKSQRATNVHHQYRTEDLKRGSIRDIQLLAGHTNLRTTQRYIEADADAQKKVVNLI